MTFRPTDRVYHKDDPQGPRGTIIETREFGLAGARALVQWDATIPGPNPPTWCAVDYLRQAT